MPRTIDVTLPELLSRVKSGQIPLDATVRVTFEESDPAPTGTAEGRDLFKQWEQEDAELTPEAQAEDERIYTAIAKNGIPRIRI